MLKVTKFCMHSSFPECIIPVTHIECHFTVGSDGSAEEDSFLEGIRKKTTGFDAPFEETSPGTFEFNQTVALNPITLAICEELQEYSETGELRWVYRKPSDLIIVKHLETLDRYWD